MSQGAGDRRSGLGAGRAVKFRRFAAGRWPLGVVDGRRFVF
jgi:hypothetical protein